MKARRTFDSLRVRNYRLWFIGQVISMAGTWTQTVAQAVLVLRLSDDNGVAAGGSVAIQYLPTLLFGVWGGLIADRVDKRRLLMMTQAGLAVVAGVLAALDATGLVNLWTLFVLVGLSGAVTAVDQPARQSFVPELVGPDLLPNAIGLNSTIFNSARIIGPSIAAAVILVAGTAACFLVNALSFLAILAGLSRMNPDELHRGAPLRRGKGQVREGIRYTWGTPLLRSNLLLMTMVGTFAFNYTVVLPLVAKVTFDGGEGTVSAAFICQGVGAFGAAIVLASLGRTDGRRLVIATGVLGVAMLAAALAPNIVLFLAIMPIMGLGHLLTASSSNALIQLDAEPTMRGRVTSLRTLTVIGSTPIGGFVAGALAEAANPRWALALGAFGCLAGIALGRQLATDRRVAALRGAGADVTNRRAGGAAAENVTPATSGSPS